MAEWERDSLHARIGLPVVMAKKGATVLNVGSRPVSTGRRIAHNRSARTPAWRLLRITLLLACGFVPVGRVADATSCEQHLHDELTLVSSSGDPHAILVLDDVRFMVLEQFERVQQADLCLGLTDTEFACSPLPDLEVAARSAPAETGRSSLWLSHIPILFSLVGCGGACGRVPHEDFPLGTFDLPEALLVERDLVAGTIQIEAATVTIELRSSTGAAEGLFERKRLYR